MRVRRDIWSPKLDLHIMVSWLSQRCQANIMGERTVFPTNTAEMSRYPFGGKNK